MLISGKKFWTKQKTIPPPPFKLNGRSLSNFKLTTTGIPRENYKPVASHWQIYHIILYRVHLAWGGFEPTKLKVIGTDCIGSYKSSYHTITTTTEIEKH
jgi:hypothetical protein